MKLKRQSLLPKFDTSTVSPAADGGPDAECVRLHRRFRKAVATKDPWLSVFEECYEYALPGKESMFLHSEGERRTDKIFDETAVVGIQEFASRLQAGIMPTFSRWADFRAGVDIPPDQHTEVNAALDEVTEHVFGILAHSNLDQEVAEAFLDLGVGTGTLDVYESPDPLQPIMFAAVPLSQVYIANGPDDRVDFIARKRKLRCSQIPLRYRGGKIPSGALRKHNEDPDHELVLVEACERDWSQPEETWVFTVYEEGSCEQVYREQASGIGSGRFICFRWSKMGGETWGRGPILNALPAIKTCNLTVQLVLENAEMAITGIYTAEDDGTMNVDTIQLLPGTIVPTALGSGGLKQVAAAGNFDVAQMVLSDMRMNIKRALYNDMLGNPDKTPASATEVSARMADLSRQIGSAFGRLQNELVQPLLQRIIYILKKRGIIKLPAVNGREIKIVANSPLSKAQAHEDVVTTTQFIGTLGQLFGPQLVNVLVKTEEAASYLADKLGVYSGILRSDQERKQILQQIAQAAGQQQTQPEAAPNAPAPTATPAALPG